MDYISLGVAGEELRYGHTSMAVTIGACRAELPHAADVGDRSAEAEVIRSAGSRHVDRDVRTDRASAGSDARGIQTTGPRSAAIATCGKARRWDLAGGTWPIHFLVMHGPISTKSEKKIRGSERVRLERTSRDCRAVREQKWGILAGTRASSTWTA